MEHTLYNHVVVVFWDKGLVWYSVSLQSMLFLGQLPGFGLIPNKQRKSNKIKNKSRLIPRHLSTLATKHYLFKTALLRRILIILSSEYVTLWYSTLGFNTLEYSTLWYSTLWYSTLGYSTLWYSTRLKQEMPSNINTNN